MTEAERIAQELDKEQVDTVRRDVLNHDAATLLRQQAAEIERLRESVQVMLDSDIGRNWVWPESARETWIANARAALEPLKPCTSDEWLSNCPQSVRDLANKIKQEKK